MRKLVLIGFALLPLAVPGLASAEISDDLAEELQGYVDEAIEAQNLTAKRGALLTWGHLADGDEREQIAEYKTADVFGVRLAAGLALMTAGDSEAKSFILEQLKSESNPYLSLQTQFAPLPDAVEVELLESLLENGETSQKRAVFRYAAERRGPVYQLLGNYVASSDEGSRSLALDAVRSTARKEALDFVASEMLPAGDSAVRQAGVDLAIRISRLPGRTQRSIETLKSAVDHDDDTVAQKAAIRLLEMHDKAGVDRLVSLLSELEEGGRRVTVAEALLAHEVAPPADAMKKLHENVDDETVKQKLLELWVASGDTEAYKKVDEMFGSTHFEQRLSAARALGHSDKEAAVKKLGKGLFEGNPKMRLAAARSLRQIAEPGSLSFLKRAISKERNAEVKIAVIEALGAIATEDAMRILRFNSRTRQPEIKKAVIQAVRTAERKDGAKILNLFFGARDTDIQWRAFVAALDVAPEVATERVEQAFRNPPDNFMQDIEQLSADRQKRILKPLLRHDNDRVRNAALEHAQRIGRPLFPLFREYLVSENVPTDVRRGLLRSLAAADGDEDLARFEKVVNQAGDENLVHQAAWALADDGSEDAEATFRGYLTGDDVALKAIGAYGLARIKRE